MSKKWFELTLKLQTSNNVSLVTDGNLVVQQLIKRHIESSRAALVRVKREFCRLMMVSSAAASVLSAPAAFTLQRLPCERGGTLNTRD